jgi:hypothetical protein
MTSQAPARYFTNAPEIVRRSVLVIHGPFKDTPCPFEILLRPDPEDDQITGLDFDAHGAQGCHFFLSKHEARHYRERNRRNKRVAWADLPARNQSAILNYLEQ